MLDVYREAIDALRAEHHRRLLALEDARPSYGYPLWTTPGAGESNILHFAIRNEWRARADDAKHAEAVEALEAWFDSEVARLRTEMGL